MFTRAGFNPRHRVVLWARTSRRRRSVWACLVVWLPSGDFGWYCSRPRYLGFLAWELRSIDDLLDLPASVHRAIWNSEACSLEEAPRALPGGPQARVAP
jgi:hypothetical protein